MAVTIKGFASDWSVPEGARTKLGELFPPRVEATPASSGPLGNQWVYLGDSITQASTDNTNTSQGASFPLWAQLFSGGRMWMARNAGIRGNTSAQMLARFDADVAPYSPQAVFLMAGTNDIGTGVSFETYKANIEAIRRKCLGVGASLGLSTILPANEAARKPKIVQWNHWLRRYAADNGLPLVDAYTLLVDPATGGILSGFNADGIHPNAAGYRALGQRVADELAPLTRQWTPPLVLDANDTTINSFSSNPILLADANADGVPDGWVAYGGSTGFTHALVTDSAAPGKMAQVTMSSAASQRIFERGQGTGTWAVGDRIFFSGVITSDGGVEATARLKFVGGALPDTPTAAKFTGAVTRGVFGMEATVPAGTTQINYSVLVGPGTGVVAFGQPTFLNLTKLGLV